MQLGNSDGLGALSGQDSTENYFGKNKSKSFDARLKRGTVIAGIFLVLCSIAFFIIKIFVVA
jgi:protein translocase SecG subunit